MCPLNCPPVLAPLYKETISLYVSTKLSTSEGAALGAQCFSLRKTMKKVRFKIIAVRQTFVYHHTVGLKAPLCEKWKKNLTVNKLER